MCVDEKEVPPSRHLPRPPKWMLPLLLLVLGFAFFGERGILNTLRMHQYKVSLQEKIEELEFDNARLRGEIDALRNNYRYLEGVARKELGMVKEGELVYQFSTAVQQTPAGSVENGVRP